MPEAIPPPPPQPTEDETRQAVRFVYGVAAGALAFFLLVAASYGPHNPLVAYGRTLPPSWALWKAERLKPAALRRHEGGQIAWLVGSSILRESFDEDGINEELGRRGSPYRVRKFGVSRGAAGVLAGLLDALPIEEGDLIVHNVTQANFHQGWVSWTDLPPYVMMYTVPASEFWHVDGWTLADKLEQASSLPFGYWQWHEEIMAGATEVLEDALWWWKRPRKTGPRHNLRFRTLETRRGYLDTKRDAGPEDIIYLPPDCCDYSDAQFNMRGVRRMEAKVAAVGATLALVHLPPRQEYEARFVHRDAAPAWQDWRARTANLSYAPRPPDEDFYDFKHPNYRGRALLSAWLLDWLEDGRPKGSPASLSWPIPDYNLPGVPVPPGAGTGKTGDRAEDDDEEQSP